MGRLTLMIVAAAVLGGATLKLGMNLIAGDTAAGRAEAQADVLARQIAETGQSLALASMVGEEGFLEPGVTGCPSPGTDGCAYDGGTFTVNSVRSPNNREVTVTVVGRFGGAMHRVENVYSFDPMEYPGPIWLDVPYATADISNAARVSGTATDHPSRFDSRKFDDVGLATIGMDRGVMASAVAGQLSLAAGALNVPANSEWEAAAGRSGSLLEDLSQQNDIVDAEGLYQSALAAMAAGDVTFAASRTVSGAETWGGRDGVTRVKGALTITGTLRGSGILLVDGPLVVQPTAAMAWSGIVIVRADQQMLPVQLLGDADITGGLVVVQNALPPGGHMDVTVARGPAGMPDAPGARPSPNWPLASPVDYPWWEHTHRFDLEPAGAPRGGHVEFARNGRGAQEAETQFWATMQALGSQQVRLEFKHPEAHGFARFALDLSSEPDLIEGSVRSGFGGFAAAGNAYRSRPFEANDLQTLTLDVQSLRALRRLFDGEGSCDGGSWPFCVGRDWSRSGALSVRVVRENDGATVYDAAVYWHMADDERAQHEAEEAAWMASISAGTFGTRLEMGPQASVTYALAPIVRMAEKVGFDGNEVHLLSSVSEHVSAAELRAEYAAGGPPTPTPTTPTPTTPTTPTPTPPTPTTPAPTTPTPTTPTTPTPTTPTTPAPTLPTGPATTPLPTPVPPAQIAPACPTNIQVAICNKPGRDGLWSDRNVTCSSVGSHLGHGCRIGTCAANGLPTTAAPTAAPACPRPAERVKVCNKPPGESSWNDYEMRCDAVAAYLIRYPTSRPGTCSSNGL